MDSIRGNVLIDGALRPGACAATLYVNHAAGSRVDEGKLTNAVISGVGQSGKTITYAQICTLDIQLSNADDTFDVNVTHTSTTILRTGIPLSVHHSCCLW
jgi:hypothetical protein